MAVWRLWTTEFFVTPCNLISWKWYICIYSFTFFIHSNLGLCQPFHTSSSNLLLLSCNTICNFFLLSTFYLHVSLVSYFIINFVSFDNKVYWIQKSKNRLANKYMLIFVYFILSFLFPWSLYLFSLQVQSSYQMTVLFWFNKNSVISVLCDLFNCFLCLLPCFSLLRIY